MKITQHEFVLERNLDLDHVMCHATHLIPLKDGGVLCVYFGGTAEKNPDVCIWGTIRNPEGLWGKPFRITEDDGVAHWNPVLHRNSDGSIVLYYKVGAEIENWRTIIRVSADEGKTFGPGQELVEGDSGGRGPVRNKIITMSNGWLAAPASLEEGYWRAFADISQDGGATWTKSEDVFLADEDGKPLGRFPLRGKRGVIQPTLWESSPAKIHMLLRSTEGKVYRSDSEDWGEHWCAPYPTELPNNNSGIDLDRLTDGRLVLAFNPVGKNWGARSPISLAISKDNGGSWETVANLETAPGEYSYPALLAQGDEVLLTYTWNRKNVAFWRFQFSV